MKLGKSGALPKATPRLFVVWNSSQKEEKSGKGHNCVLELQHYWLFIFRFAMKSLFSFLCALGVCAFGSALPARAATFSVSNLNDSGAGSLRQAITDANNAAGDDAIDFAPGLGGIITLSGGELSLSSNVSIIAPQASSIVLNGNNASRVFRMSAGTVRLGNLTITGGHVGGGGYSAGVGDGAGIRQDGGGLSLENCTLSGNTVSGGFGGAMIRYGGSTTLSNCTISGNNAGDASSPGDGAGLDFEAGSTTLSNCTITGNTGHPFGSTSSYGGGIYINGGSTCTLDNTLVADNSAPNGPDIFGSATSAGHNLIGQSDGSSGFSNGAQGDLVGTTASPVFPRIGPLAANGGPTQTHALLAGSPAINAGQTTLATDQRSFARDSSPDIGSFEFGVAPITQNGPDFVVNSADDHNDGACTSTDCTLREAVQAANANPDKSAISFGGFVFASAQTIVLSGTQLNLNSDISLQGPGARMLTVKGGLIVAGSTTSSLSGLTLANGSGITNGGTLAVNSCALSGNQNTDGGAISNNGTLTLNNSTFSGNFVSSSFGRGGAIYNPGTLTVNNSTFSGNSSNGAGGALFNEGTATINNSTFSGNSAKVGGGIDAGSGSLILNNSIVANNTAVVTGANILGPVNGGDYNLVPDGRSLPGTHNITGQDPKLGTLANNGGPTDTFAIAFNSPARSAGDPAFAGTGQFDQRGSGYPRVSGGRVDIGAFEFQNHAPVLGDASFTFAQNQPVNGARLAGTDADGDSLTYSVTGGTLPDGITLGRDGTFSGTPTRPAGVTVQVTVSDGQGGTTVANVSVFVPESPSLVVNDTGDSSTRYDGRTSLREAINYANTLSGSQSITFDATVFAAPRKTITVAVSLPSIKGTVSITGGSAGVTILDTGRSFETGAFITSGTVVLENLTVQGAQDYDVAAFSGSLTVRGCTLIGSDKGLANQATVTVQNCTITGSNLGILNQGLTPMTVQNCTITGNSTGIYNQNSLVISDSIVTGNTTNIVNRNNGTISSSSHNIVDGDAGLDPNGFQDNGGPTQTIALVAGSPAINAGQTTLTTDQRGIARDSRPDIGSFEFSSFVPSLSVNTISDEDNGTSDPRFGTGTSLREAINYANAKNGSDTISFDSNVFSSPMAIRLADGQSLPAITDDLTINGPASGVGIAGKVGAPLLTINPGVTANLSLLGFSGGRTSLFNQGTLNLTLCALTNTVTDLVNTGRATLVNSRVQNSRIGVDNSGTLIVQGCSFINNTTGLSNASGAGADVTTSSIFRSVTGILNGGTLKLSNSTLNGNTDGVRSSGTANVIQNTFAFNSGTAVTGSGGTLIVNRCTISGNGTGLSTGGAQTTLRNSLLVGNLTNLSGTATRAYNLLNSTPAQAGLQTEGNGAPVLQDNGGPTQTIALLPGASVINRADPAISQGTDQRTTGFARVVNGRADIGAFEFQGTPPAPAPSSPSAASTNKSSAPSA